MFSAVPPPSLNRQRHANEYQFLKNSSMYKKLFLLFLVYFFSFESCFPQGNGSDGPLNVICCTTTINTVRTPVSGTNGSGTTINVGSTAGFFIGNEVLVMQMQGTNSGSYDELIITSLTATSLTFSSSTSVTYATSGLNLAQVILIPQYTTVNVSAGATLTGPAWNGSTGGVLIYYANGAVTINGTITMTGNGFTGGTGGAGNAAGTLGSGGTGGAIANAAGLNANPIGGGAGGGSPAGAGGNGGQGSILAPISGNSGTGVGAGTSGVAGTNMSSGSTILLMGGGGGGGQGGQGGQGGGGGGGGGAASNLILGSIGANGVAGIVGTASIGAGGIGGTGGGIILMRIASMTGTGTVLSNGSIGSNGIGTGGNGGHGGNGGNGGGGLAAVNSGGGGGGGKGGQGGQGPGGGGGGGSGVIAVLVGNLISWTGSVSSIAGTGGVGGAGGSAGISGSGGAAGATLLLGGNGSAGNAGGAIAPSLTGPAGSPNAAGQLPIVLPIELISFKGNITGEKNINLVWQTSSEKNNSHFIIYKSGDGINFSELGKVSGAGNSNIILDYNLHDLNPNNGINYYKLTQVDFDGKQSSYKIISVNYEFNTHKLMTYPNPIGDNKIIHFLTDQLDFTNNELVEIVVLNSLGEVVHQENRTISGFYEYTVNLNSLPSGIYYLNLTSVSRRYHTEKIIIY
jgi:hypothetical protein